MNNTNVFGACVCIATLMYVRQMTQHLKLTLLLHNEMIWSQIKSDVLPVMKHVLLSF